MKKIILALSLICFKFIAVAEPIFKMQNFIFMGGDSDLLHKSEKMFNNSKIDGVQVVYTWKSLEIDKDKYDFSKIENDLNFLNKLNKKLFVQVQDRFFSPQAKYVPNYIMHDPEYTGGLTKQLDNPGENKPLVTGWVTQQWNPAIRLRYQKLIQALASKFDGRIYGINLPETSIDIDIKNDCTGFTCDKYFKAVLENITVARNAFKKSYVVQYVNFFPCEWDNDHKYMSRLFEMATTNNIGLGGPDIVPYKKAQMKNSYPFFHKYRGKLPLVAMAIQEPTMTYINPKTNKNFTYKEFTDFAINYLGVNIIFWTIDAANFFDN